MEYMRDDEKKEPSTQASSGRKANTADCAEVEVTTTKVAAWQENQKEGKSGNMAVNRIKTFGKKKC